MRVAACVFAVAIVALQQPPASLVYPVDVVADGDGWVIADFKAHGLLRVDADGQPAILNVGPGRPRTPLYGARAVIAAPDGDGWLVADPATFALYRVDRGGALSTITTELDIPQGLVAFDQGSVLVSDLRSGIGGILRVGLDGAVRPFADVPSPKGIVTDGADGFAVVSHGERAVFLVGRDGSVRTLAAGAPLDFPHDLVRDDDGSFVVTDGYAAALFRIDRQGAISIVAQGAPLVSPQGIAGAADGGYIVVDPQAGALFRVGTDGSVATLVEVGGS